MKTPRLQNLLSVVLLSGVLSGCDRADAPKSPTSSDAAPNNTNQPAPAATSIAAFEKLKGRWQRPDGGYVIEIRGASPDGKLDAGYFNPQSINVAKAVASQEGGSLKVFVELRDVNYPGSTYTLMYDPTNDRLKGIYFQAVERQQFEVFFERLK
jgi:hypothetical protein